MNPEIVLLLFSSLILYVVWNNYQDIQTIKNYKQQQLRRPRRRECQTDNCGIYPWWHTGFSHGGFNVGPWTWNRRQFYYHPSAGWYLSPFAY